jgi:hypothetical protein
MKKKIEFLIPFIIIGIFVYLFYTNNKTPTLSPNSDNYIIQPKKETVLLRTDSKKDSPENDNRVTFTHIKSGDKLDLLMYHDYLLLPNGETTLPTKINEETKKAEPIWKVEHTKKDVIFETNLDIGVFCGYIPGGISSYKDSNVQVGIRLSPVRIYNTLAVDFLTNDRIGGIGLSYYPSVIKYGEFWNHLGVGVGKVMDYHKGDIGNMVYLGFSTKF